MKKEKVSVTLSYEEEKLTALQLYLAEKHLQVEEELIKGLDALYGKTVPQSVRQYIELRTGSERSNPAVKKARTELPATEASREEGTGHGE